MRRVQSLDVCIFGSVFSIKKGVSPVNRAENVLSENAECRNDWHVQKEHFVMEGHITLSIFHMEDLATGKMGYMTHGILTYAIRFAWSLHL